MPRWTRRTSASSSQRMIFSIQWSLARSRATRLLTGTSPKMATLGWLKECLRMVHSSPQESFPMVRWPPSKTFSRGLDNLAQTRTLDLMEGTRWLTSPMQAIKSELTKGWSRLVPSKTPHSSWTSTRTCTKMHTSLTRHQADSWTLQWTKVAKILDWRRAVSSRRRGLHCRPPRMATRQAEPTTAQPLSCQLPRRPLTKRTGRDFLTRRPRPSRSQSIQASHLAKVWHRWWRPRIPR